MQEVRWLPVTGLLPDSKPDSITGLSNAHQQLTAAQGEPAVSSDLSRLLRLLQRAQSCQPCQAALRSGHWGNADSSDPEYTTVNRPSSGEHQPRPVGRPDGMSYVCRVISKLREVAAIGLNDEYGCAA